MLRNALPTDVDRLGKIWYEGWQDAHARLLPDELKRLRTPESFRERLLQRLASTRLAELDGQVVGFRMLRDDELYQLFISKPARGTGVAAALMADAEMCLKEAGVVTAWLACAIGNDRAARFYEKCGWERAGSSVIAVETSEDQFELEVWRYEKRLDHA